MSLKELCFALSLVGIQYAAASMWALTKFSYSSFSVSDISLSALNLFFSVIVYLLLISLLSVRYLFCVAFLQRLYDNVAIRRHPQKRSMPHNVCVCVCIYIYIYIYKNDNVISDEVSNQNTYCIHLEILTWNRFDKP